MKILVLGRSGLLGRAVIEEAIEREIEFFSWGSSKNAPITFEKLNSVCQGFQPTIIINCLAYTNVDGAQENQEEANYLNHEIPQMLINLADVYSSKLIHISTDYVFDGNKLGLYHELDQTNPTSVYGMSKLLGERKIELSNYLNFLIIRVSWLFGPHKTNFLEKIKNLAIRATKENPLKVINDQIGGPTYTLDLSKAIFDLIEKDSIGLYHFSNNGFCSWFDFAEYYLDKFNLNEKIIPCSSDEFKTKAPRPKNSRFDLEKIQERLVYNIPHWKKAVDSYCAY